MTMDPVFSEAIAGGTLFTMPPEDAHDIIGDLDSSGNEELSAAARNVYDEAMVTEDLGSTDVGLASEDERSELRKRTFERFMGISQDEIAQAAYFRDVGMDARYDALTLRYYTR